MAVNEAGDAAGGGGRASLKLNPPTLDLTVDRFAAFTAWKEKWDDYVLLSQFDQQNKKTQSALLRYTFSSDTRKIYNSLGLTAQQKEDPDVIIDELQKFAKGTINEILERHCFNNRKQQDGETFDDFLTELKVLATNCNYCAACYPNILRDRIVEGVISDELRGKLIEEKTLDLEKAVEKCRSFEIAADGVKTMSGHQKNGNNIDRVGGGGGDDRRNSSRNGNNEPRDCKFCLKKHKWGRNFCPAFGKTCNACKKNNHFEGSSICNKSQSGAASVDQENAEGTSTTGSINEVSGYMEVMFMGSVQVSGGDEKSLEIINEVATEVDESHSSIVDEHKKIVVMENIKEGIVAGYWSLMFCMDDISLNDQVEAQYDEENSQKFYKKSRQERRSDERFTKKLIDMFDKINEDSNNPLIDSVEGESSVKEIDDDFYIRVKAGHGDVRLKLDTGADVTVIRPDCLPLFGITKDELHPTCKTLRAASGNELVCHGYFVRKLNYKGKAAKMLGYVCENVQLNLLGKPELKQLELIKINNDETVDACSADENAPEFLEYPRMFNSMGQIKGEPIDIKLDMQGQEPYHLSCARRVAIPHLKWLEEELNQMESLGLIKKVTEPTDWCHPIVLAEKPGSNKLRLCLDLTKLNKCVKREFYQLPSVAETMAKIGKKGKIFSKLDANKGFWQMPLTERSQKLCTFITPFGRYCPTVGPFGLSSMPEIFSRKMDEIIFGLPGVVKNMDDFLIFGETVEEHDKNLHNVLKVMNEYNMSLNKSKCFLRKQKVDFLGFTVSDEGIVPKEERLSAIREFRRSSLFSTGFGNV